MNSSWMKHIAIKPATGVAVLALMAAGLGLRTLSAPAPKLKAAVIKAAPIHLRLTAERRRTITDAQGQTQETWQPLTDAVAVQPGDTLRYTLRVENSGPRPVSDFVLTQPIPSGVVLETGSESVAGADGVQTVFRVAGQTGFSATPTVDAPQPDGSVKPVPAPAEAFRAVRWVFTQPLAPAQSAQAVFVEKVR